MNEKLVELVKQCRCWSGPTIENDVDIEKFVKFLVRETRIKAIEELRQEVKWASWPIDSLVIVEKACEDLWKKEPDNRYVGYSK